MFDGLMDDLADLDDEAAQGELWALWGLLPAHPEASVSTEISGLGPGLMSAATLDAVDLESLSGSGGGDGGVGADGVSLSSPVVGGDDLGGRRRCRNAADAGGDLALIEDGCATEIRAALWLTRRTADTELAIARGFRERLPAVWEALAVGVIDRRRAGVTSTAPTISPWSRLGRWRIGCWNKPRS